MSNISQVVNEQKSLTTFKKGVIASGLDKVLTGKGPFTVFAPADIAFGKLVAGTMEDLLKPGSKTKLLDLFSHHVVAGKISFKDLKDGDKLNSVNGKELVVKVNHARVSVGGSVILSRDLQTSNGVIHLLDKVVQN